MSIRTAIARWRRNEEALFDGQCVVTRVTSEGAFNPTTGAVAPDTTAEVYNGVCLVRSVSWQGADTQTGEQEVRMRSARMKLPHDTAIEKDDVVTVSSSQGDPELVGREFRITDVLRDDWQIVRVALLEEIT